MNTSKFHILLIYLLLAPGLWVAQAQNSTGDTLRVWRFDRWNDREGWNCQELLGGTVRGGTFWLTIQPERNAGAAPSWKDQVWGKGKQPRIASPDSLGIDASKYNKVVMRLRNLSPETDGLVYWRTADNMAKDNGPARFTMKPDCNEWQEAICHIDGKWTGTVDQIAIQPARMGQRGDIFIDWIAIARGEPKPAISRPDVCSSQVVPFIEVPGVSQENFRDAFKVLDECLVTDVPLNGFTYPYMAPGGAYGENWWQLDASLNIAGAKWANQKLAEDMMRGFADVQAQNPDGRIDLWGGSPMRGEPGDVSSLPRYFEAAYDVACRSNDSSLQTIVLETMKKYLGYWLSSKKRDQTTGLITGVFEETFSNPHQDPGVVAPVDLNVAVAVGCYNTAKLAQYLGKNEEAKRYSDLFNQLSASINQYLWDEASHFYFNYFVPEHKHDPRYLCSAFDVLQLGIAPVDRTKRMLPYLTDPSVFNWGIRPLATISRKEPGFLEATGIYDGRAWFGDVWTLRNLTVVNGLKDAGEPGLAAELNWQTIKAFNGNYSEYLVPSTGSGEGVKRYGWTASQYIQAIIENLFGVGYNVFEKRLRIIPHIPKELINKEISISNLTIPSHESLKLNLRIIPEKEGKTIFKLNFSGKIPKEAVEIGLFSADGRSYKVTDKKGRTLAASKSKAMKNLTFVKVKMNGTMELFFE